MIMTSVSFLLGLILCLLFGIPYIDFLKKRMIGQYIREEAPESHNQKAGTPTTGGVFIIIAALLASVTTLFMAEKFTDSAWIILITFLFYALAGFQDDFLKIKGHENKGLSARGKFLRQIIIALLPIFYAIQMYGSFGTQLSIGNYVIDLGWWYPILAVIAITGASNAYNLTDGLDGLAASTGVPAFVACSAIALLSHYDYIAIISAAMAGALLGFLKYNKPKAQVFMGDTGTLAIMGKFELYLIILAGVFVIECLSVMIQVTSFKLTGKRVFKMSPIHHHFELCGFTERQIVKGFAIASCIFSVLAVLLFELFHIGVL
mgnify:CR=1 FL=1